MTCKRIVMLMGLCTAMLVLLAGCGQDEPEQEVVHRPPPPPPAPAPPPVKSIAELMQELRIDDRVYLPENQAPGSTEARQAILEFFDAFARSDDRALSPILSPEDRNVLEAMVASGDWARATGNITSIEIQTGPSPYGNAVLALYVIGDLDFEPQLWYYRQQDERYVFEAAPSPPNMMSRLSGTDWIASWHDILEEEDSIAIRPDTPIDLPQRSIEEPPISQGG